jgi:hypothetical protein
MINGNAVGGTAPIKTVKIVDENGLEILGVVTESEVIFTATDNDVREGSVYAGDGGVSIGTKVIPSYHVTEGRRVIKSGKRFEIPHLDLLDLYDFTKFQAVACVYTGDVETSVATDKVAIGELVYLVNSTEPFATIVRDADNKKIDLGFINESENSYVLRYFTYKEIY